MPGVAPRFSAQPSHLLLGLSLLALLPLRRLPLLARGKVTLGPDQGHAGMDDRQQHHREQHGGRVETVGIGFDIGKRVGRMRAADVLHQTEDDSHLHGRPRFQSATQSFSREEALGGGGRASS